MHVDFHGGSVDYGKGSAVAPDVEFRCNHPIVSCKFAIYADRNGNGEMDPDEQRYSAKREFESEMERSNSVVLEGGDFKVEKEEGTLRWITEVRILSGATWSSSGLLSDALRFSK